MSKPAPRIAIYGDFSSKASVSPLDAEIRRSFPGHNIERVDRHDISRASFYKDLLLFVLPGIEGENSLYHEHIGPSNHLIREYISNGGRFFAQCAGAYYATNGIEFMPEWAPWKRRHDGLLGLFNGYAHGPVPHIGVDGEDPRYYRGLTHARVAIDMGDYGHTIPLVYSSGPAFIPNDAQAIRIIGRYADGDDKPAVISFDYGRGLVVLSGPVPQYGALPPIGAPQFETLDALFDILRPYEKERIAFFDQLMRQFKNHAIKTGLQP